MDDKQILIQSYEELPYPSFGCAYPLSHPRRIAAIAKLFGHSPTAPEKARVLELGCASASNLLPMAHSLPNASFLGLDIASPHVTAAKKAIASSQLSNVEVRQSDLLEFNIEPQSFDYIICHGVYSWVSADVQRRILDICSKGIGQNGLAYISYNTYPGWHMISSVRDMMRFHSDSFPSAKEKVDQSKALLNFVSEALNSNNTAYSLLLRQEAQRLNRAPDGYLYHDHLEHENHPIYFSDFINEAGRVDLQYVGEAELKAMIPYEFSKEVVGTLKKLSGSIHRMEQFLDFLRNTTFRRTILCKKDISLNHQPNPKTIMNLSASSAYQEVTRTPTNSKTKFVHRNGSFIEISDGPTTEALRFITKNSPRWIPLADVAQHAAKTNTVAQSDKFLSTLSASLLQLAGTGGIELHVGNCPISSSLPRSPSVSPIARFEATNARAAVNLAHEPVQLSNFAAVVFTLCDGSMTSEEICNKLIEKCKAGEFTPSKDGKPIMVPTQQEAAIKAMLANTLKTMQKNGFFTNHS